MTLVKVLLKMVFFFCTLPFRVLRFAAGMDGLYYAVSRQDLPPVTAPPDAPPIPQNYLTHGGGTYRIYKGRLLVEGSGGGGGMAYHENGYRVALGGGHGFFAMGWVLNLLPFLRVYPLVGLGGGGMGSALYKADPRAPNRPPANRDEVHATGGGGPLLNLGVGVELKIGYRYGIILGVRAGYLIAPDACFVQTHLRGQFPYIRFTVGLGRLSRPQRQRPLAESKTG